MVQQSLLIISPSSCCSPPVAATSPSPQHSLLVIHHLMDWLWDDTGVFDARAANVNGDFVADVFFYSPVSITPGQVISDPSASSTVFIPAGNYYSLVDLPGTAANFDMQDWRSTDINGDGLADWVYVRYANPGLTVLSQIANGDGTRQVHTPGCFASILT